MLGQGDEKCPILALGLLLGLQIGVTFSEIRGYTFGVFGGRIEGERKGWF